MLVEIGFITSLESGQRIYNALADDEEIQMMFMEKGRSDAPFVERQFGEFGETAVITIISEEEKYEGLSRKIFKLGDVGHSENGIILINKRIAEKKDLPKN